LDPYLYGGKWTYHEPYHISQEEATKQVNLVGEEFEVLGEERIIAKYTSYTLPKKRNDTKSKVAWS
jgi:hypothetical protein